MSESAKERAKRLIRKWHSFGNELDLPLETNLLIREFLAAEEAAEKRVNMRLKAAVLYAYLGLFREGWEKGPGPEECSGRILDEVANLGVNNLTAAAEWLEAHDIAIRAAKPFDDYARGHAAGVAEERERWTRNRPEIVCLCGSTRFKAQYEAEAKRLGLDGKIVLSVAYFAHADEGGHHDAAAKERLDTLHLRKIDLADRILIINPGGYIGDSTRREIQYATSIGKPVEYLAAAIREGEEK